MGTRVHIAIGRRHFLTAAFQPRFRDVRSSLRPNQRWNPQPVHLTEPPLHRGKPDHPAEPRRSFGAYHFAKKTKQDFLDRPKEGGINIWGACPTYTLPRWRRSAWRSRCWRPGLPTVASSCGGNRNILEVFKEPISPNSESATFWSEWQIMRGQKIGYQPNEHQSSCRLISLAAEADTPSTGKHIFSASGAPWRCHQLAVDLRDWHILSPLRSSHWRDHCGQLHPRVCARKRNMTANAGVRPGDAHVTPNPPRSLSVPTRIRSHDRTDTLPLFQDKSASRRPQADRADRLRRPRRLPDLHPPTTSIGWNAKWGRSAPFSTSAATDTGQHRRQCNRRLDHCLRCFQRRGFEKHYAVQSLRKSCGGWTVVATFSVRQRGPVQFCSTVRAVSVGGLRGL